MRHKTKTFKRCIVAWDSKKDFGLGPGVLVTDVIKFKDEGGRGFDNPMFSFEVLKANEKFLNQHLKVTMEEIKPKRRIRK